MDEVFCISCKSCANPFGAVADIATPCLQKRCLHTCCITGNVSCKDDTRGISFNDVFETRNPLDELSYRIFDSSNPFVINKVNVSSADLRWQSDSGR